MMAQQISPKMGVQPLTLDSSCSARSKGETPALNWLKSSNFLAVTIFWPLKNRPVFDSLPKEMLQICI